MAFLESESRFAMSLGEAGLIALLGYLVVFFGLVLLMCVIILVGKYMVKQREKAAAKKNTAIQENVAAETVTFEEVSGPVAPGSAGEVKLHGVEPRTAALLMAIVADKMNKPINELRFISIREVE